MTFSEQVKEIIKKVPYGRVVTYGQVAFMAGNYQAARQVAWVLHSCSERDGLPWHRVVNSKGGISLPRGDGYEEQKNRLLSEGIPFNKNDHVDLTQFMWREE